MGQPFSLYDTRRRGVFPLEPLLPGRLGIYTCGPTVYGSPHIGNYRTYIAQDVLVRALTQAAYQVNRVMNVTDVGHLTSDADEGEDKLQLSAEREATTAWDIAARYEAEFLADLDALGIILPTHLVRATDTISEQIALIQQLEAKGYTYQTADGLYYDSAKFASYPDFARLDLAGQQAGSRVAVGDKRNPSDFALWKFSPPDKKRDMEWESPWGRGFPGWHLECSAIALRELGPELDIHCGGVDHIPVHHTNEIAQSEAATGQPLARHWFHTDFLLVDDTKMSKSIGNLYTLADLRNRQVDLRAFRLFVYSASYRAKLNFTWEGLAAAERSLERLRSLAQSGGEGSEQATLYLERFDAALADDLNVPAALAVVWELLRAPLQPAERHRAVVHVDAVLALDLYREPAQVEISTLPSELQQLIAQRIEARATQDWATSDSLREQLARAGYGVEDTQAGQRVKKVTEP